MISDAMPPYNAEAESGVVGALLLDPAFAGHVAAILEPGDFFGNDRAEVYRAIRARIDAGLRVDTLLIADDLRTAGLLDRMGGLPFLVAFVESVPHAAHVEHYAGIVREKSIKRRLLAAANETAADIYRDDSTAADVLRHAEERIFAVGDAEAAGDTREIGAFADEAEARLGRRRGGEVGGVSTGLVDLDDMIDGLAPGQLVVLAARPSQGKTALALSIANHAAFAAAVPTLFVSLEMPGVELAERLIVSRSGIDGYKVRTGQSLGEREMSLLDNTFHDLRGCRRLFIDDTAIRTPSQIAANARRHKARHAIGLVVVDYLQLVEAGRDAAHRASRQEQVAAVSRRLKALAKELALPVLALAQLNRQSELREDRRPRLADLRESGAIEADADVVMLLHRAEFYDPNDSPGMADLIVAKNRNGPTGVVRLVFRKHLARFESFSPIPPPADDIVDY